MNADATTAADDGSPQYWLKRAGRISDAYGLVLLLTLVTFLVTSLLPTTDWSRGLSVVLSGLTSLVGLTSSQVSPPRVRRAAVLVLLACLLAFASASTHTEGMMAAAQTITAGLLLVTASTILKRVLTSPAVTFRTILGALTTYTMFGLLFSFVYAATGVIQGHPFFASGQKAGGDFLFFSYTTLTTTGYGDLVPAGQPGKSFAVFEMLLGQIFLVTLVAGLVSLWRPGQRYDKLVERERGPTHDA